MVLDAVRTLAELVAIESVNPMGETLSTIRRGEEPLTSYLESTARSLAVAYRRHPVETGRDNLLIRIDGHPSPEHGGPLILLDVHQDTVPASSADQFRPAVRNGRLYGRGACDVKGGMAAALAAAARLSTVAEGSRPTVIIACTVNEEYGFSGARALADWLTTGAEGFIPRLPDAAIVIEPTELDVVVAHKGVVRWQCRTAGRACHSSRPEAGENAIYRMAKVIQALEAYNDSVLHASPRHPLCGEATMSVGTIRGGTSVNIVPDHCVVEIDRRLHPAESPERAWLDAQAYLEGQAATARLAIFDRPSMQAPALSDAANGGLAARLSQAAGDVAGRGRRIGVPYATNAPFYAALGIPTVVFGPGSAAQAHTEDEWISLDQLRHAEEIFYRVATTW